MMETKILKFRLKGNASFNIREGWLHKGMLAVEKNPYVFTISDASEVLGVGSKMVTAIKYWLLTTGLCEERIVSNRKGLYITTNLGKIIQEYDPYFEDMFTLYILHSKIVANKENSIVWNLFFNNFNVKEFTKDEMFSMLQHELEKVLGNNLHFSQSLFIDDCNSVLKMYADSNSECLDPEENQYSPFISLGLLKRTSTTQDYSKYAPKFGNIDKLAILYVMMSKMEDSKHSVNSQDLLNQDNNIGHVFNLTRPIINEYLDQLKNAGFIELNRTGNIDVVYVKKSLTQESVLRTYYTQE